MTENRCIEVLKKMKHMFTETCAKIDENTALNMAVEAIKEIQQYRAIGLTPKMVKEMVESEKLASHQAIIRGAKLEQYEAIGTIDEFKALKEKNTPMELDEHNFQDEVHHYLCPSCRSIVSCTQNYCEECGQALET